MSNVHTMPAKGRRVISSLSDEPLAQVEGIHRDWGLF
jgi:hypothetical protein